MPADTVVLQSHGAANTAGWIQTCTASVRGWADSQGFAYQFIGDEIFELLPTQYRSSFATRGPILSDLARLLALRNALAGRYKAAIWADADLLIFDPGRLGNLQTIYRGDDEQFTLHDCAFGLETWVDHDQRGRLRSWSNVHNALMVFSRDSVVLPYLIRCIESISKRIDKATVAPQTFGPKLLSALHNISGFDLIDRAGAFSPPVCADIARGGGQFVDKLVTAQPATPAATNLCASLVKDERQMQIVCDRLLTEGLNDPLTHTNN